MPSISGRLPAPLRAPAARPLVRRISKALTAVDRRLVRAGRRSIGGRVAGRPVLLLTTTGRRSGRPHMTPLIYSVMDDRRLLLVAANGAASWRPDWLLNVMATADVTVEIGAVRTRARARVLTPRERAARWDDACGRFPGLEAAQAASSRPIDVVELTLAP